MVANFEDCIRAAAQDGSISEEAREAFERRYRELLEDLQESEGVPFPERRVRAAQRLQQEVERRTRRNKRIRLKQAMKLQQVRARLASVPQGQVEAAALAVLDFDPSLRIVGENVAMRHEVIRNETFAGIADLIDKKRSRRAGLSRPAQMDDVVRGLFGEKTTPEAKTMADALMEQRERLVGRFNLAGGDIALRKDWGWVQRHSADRIAEIDRDTWVEFTRERLDPSRMLDDTGQRMTDRAITMSLQGTYDRIVHGDLEAVAGQFPEELGSPVYGRVQQRELVFRDSAAWLEYQRRFGFGGDILGAITGELDRFSREVAIMEVLGPQPVSTLRAMEKMIEADRIRTGSKRRGFGRLRAVMNEVTGEANIAERPGFARFMQGTRNLITASRLGGAIFASLADAGTASARARINGIPQARLAAQWARQLNPADAEHRKLAARTGYIAETWIGRSVGAQRLMGEITGPGWTSTVTDTSLRLTGLNAWTDGGRAAFGLELIGHMTDQARHALDDVEPALQSSLRRHGITAEQWDLYRSTAIWEDEATGAQFIRPEDVWLEADAMTGLPLGEKEARFHAAQAIGQMIRIESRFAIIEPTARARALISRAGPPGSFIGEAFRSVALFRSFAVSYSYLQGSQIFLSSLTRGQKAGLAATLFVSATAAGALAEQASSISRGQSPRDMSDPRFWVSAIARGGSLGPVGDFLFSDVSRHGNSLAGTLLGPVFGQAELGLNLVVGNIRELIETGEVRNPGRDLVRFAEGLTPGQSIWYARLAIERLIKDQIQEAIDGGEARKSFRRVERKARRDFDQRYWWRPGEAAPEVLN